MQFTSRRRRKSKPRPPKPSDIVFEVSFDEEKGLNGWMVKAIRLRDAVESQEHFKTYPAASRYTRRMLVVVNAQHKQDRRNALGRLKRRMFDLIEDLAETEVGTEQEKVDLAYWDKEMSFGS